MSCCTGTMERTRDDGREEGSVSAAILNDDVGFVHQLERRHRQHRQLRHQPLPPKKTRRSASRNHHRRRCNKVEVQQEEAVHKLFPTLELELLTVWVCCTARRWFRCCCRSPGLQSVMIRAVLYTSIGGHSTSFSCSNAESSCPDLLSCWLVCRISACDKGGNFLSGCSWLSLRKQFCNRFSNIEESESAYLIQDVHHQELPGSGKALSAIIGEDHMGGGDVLSPIKQVFLIGSLSMPSR